MSQPREMANHQRDFSACVFCGRKMAMSRSGQLSCVCPDWQDSFARKRKYPAWAYDAAVEIQKANHYYSHDAAARMARIIGKHAGKEA